MTGAQRSPTASACEHCGLMFLAGTSDGGALEFCSRGCQAAHDLIRRAGLSHYYRLVAAQDQTVQPVGDVVLRYQDFDHPEFLSKHVRGLETGAQRCTMVLDGLHCAACVWLLEKLPVLVGGVASARVNWARSTLDVQWEREQTSLARIAQTVAELGYRPHPLPLDAASRAPTDDREILTHIGVAGAAAGNNMILAIALYLGVFSSMSAAITDLLRMASCAVGLVSILGPGRIFMRGAWVAVRTRTPHMDVPIALGLGVGAVAGLWNTLRGTGEIYFDTLSVLVFLLLVGRWLQKHQQRRAAAAVDILSRLTPAVAHKYVRGQRADVPAEVLGVGDEIEVLVGETFPADGRVTSGRTSVDETILTGESRPVSVEQGGNAHAGTVNLGTPVRMKVAAVGRNTRIGRIAEIVENAASERPAMVQWADRMGGYFVVAVVAVAVATLAVWMVLDSSLAVDHTVALLIVSCPCALGLATPLALSAGMSVAARHRILVKEGDVFQRLARPGTVWLDKTGTLTTGRVEVIKWHGAKDVQGMVASLERLATHPVARALVAFLDRHDVVPSDEPVVLLRAAGGGVAGRFGIHTVAVGNEAFVHSTGACVSPSISSDAHRAAAAGYSPVYVALNGETVAWASLGDPLRPGARTAVDRLRGCGWQVGILSGDHPDIVRRLGDQLGLSAHVCHGGLTPEDKVRRIVHTPGHTVMVGDGVNDGAALAAASVGIAAHGSAETSLRAAPVYLATPGIEGVLDLIAGSRGVMATIRRNLGLSLGYNALAVSLAACGVINPLVAAILMPASSLSVVGSSLLVRWRATT